jgi:hyaluronan synthase
MGSEKRHLAGYAIQLFASYVLLAVDKIRYAPSRTGGDSAVTAPAPVAPVAGNLTLMHKDDTPGTVLGPSRRSPPRSAPSSDEQRAGLVALINIAKDAGGADEPVPQGRRSDHVSVRGRNARLRRRGQGGLPPEQVAAGALNDWYDIPVTTFSRKGARGLFFSCVLVAAMLAWRTRASWTHPVYIPVLAAATPLIAFRAFSWLMSWRDRPATVDPVAQARLDRLNVVVTVPVYNEDPALLDRCLYALINQFRPPQRVDVIDDGSKLDYRRLRYYWEGTWPRGTEVRWLWQANQGKRRAHALTFATAPEADIFVTVDSDTTLDHYALEEGLKPFSRRQVMSVAGIELGFNAYANFLTRIQATLQLFSQAVIGATWAVMGDMYTNRGPFALYRAPMVREVIELYRNETFLGRRVVLGDDSLLAICASGRGKSVQQLSAFGMTMFPETLGHHLRQRVRWARGRTVRNFWRVRYYPLYSYIWWFTVIGIYAFLASVGITIAVIVTWPASAHAAANMLLALYMWNCLKQMRVLCFRRNDETWLDRVYLVILRPISGFWASIVLSRIVRAYGTLTFLRQGWTTRQQGAELVFSQVEDSIAA